MNRYEIRRLNLIRLKDEICSGKIVNLAKRLNKNPSFVARLLYEDGKKYKKNIADKLVSDIESSFCLPRGWLDGLSADNQLAQQSVHQANKTEKNGIKIEALNIKDSCRNDTITEHEIISVLRSVEFTTEFALNLFSGRSAEYIKVITAKDDSMSPTIKSGACVYVDTKINYYDGDGVYVFVFDNVIYIKRLQVTATEVIVISDNTIYEKWRLDKKSFVNFHIQGKVFLVQNIKYTYI